MYRSLFVVNLVASRFSPESHSHLFTNLDGPVLVACFKLGYLSTAPPPRRQQVFQLPNLEHLGFTTSDLDRLANMDARMDEAGAKMIALQEMLEQCSSSATIRSQSQIDALRTLNNNSAIVMFEMKLIPNQFSMAKFLRYLLSCVERVHHYGNKNSVNINVCKVNQRLAEAYEQCRVYRAHFRSDFRTEENFIFNQIMVLHGRYTKFGYTNWTNFADGILMNLGLLERIHTFVIGHTSEQVFERMNHNLKIIDDLELEIKRWRRMSTLEAASADSQREPTEMQQRKYDMGLGEKNQITRRVVVLFNSENSSGEVIEEGDYLETGKVKKQRRTKSTPAKFI